MKEDKKKKVTLICVDNVGKVMAGPGVRYFEMAKALSQNFDITLFVPNQCDLEPEGFKIIIYNSGNASRSISKQIDRDTSAVIAQTLRPPLHYFLRKHKIRFITDLYDPLTVETLEQIKYDSNHIQKKTFDFVHYMQALQIECADHILCASDRQRDFYIGTLFGTKAISPQIYTKTPDFKRIISLAPFGFSDKDPVFTDQNMVQNKFPQIKDTDKLIYWGGGLFNWFDPLSIIKAIEKISKTRNDIKFVFLGGKHPNPKIKQMEMSQRTYDYCNEHGLTDKLVFFNYDWTPYQDRVNYLLRSSIGISTHFDNLETRFSFRTRVLDYLWADLPMILTEGDFMADFVKEHNLGKIVRYENIDDIADAIIEVLDRKDEFSENIKKVKGKFYWANIIKDFSAVIENDNYVKRKKSSLKFFLVSIMFYYCGLKKKLFK